MRKRRRDLFGVVDRIPLNIDDPVSVRISTGQKTLGATLTLTRVRRYIDGSNCCLSSEPEEKCWLQWFLLDKRTGRLTGYQ